MPRIWGEITDDGTIKPETQWAHVIIDGFKPGDRVTATIDHDRNSKFNSLFHLCLSLLAKAINRGPASTSVDQLKRWVKLKKGWYRVVPLDHHHDGITHAVDYKSVAFAKMGEEEFHRFATDACELIRTELAPWVDKSPEWREVRAIVDSILEPAALTVKP